MRPAAGVSLMAPGRVPALNPAAAGAIGASRLEEARRLLVRGKVVDARSVLESALAITPAAALHELARTYDPYYLGMLSSIDDGSEPRRAAELYHEAIVHGSSAAGNDLDRLRASYPHTR